MESLKSVTKIGVDVLGAVPVGKIKDIKFKFNQGEHIVGITDIQLQIIYER